MNDTTQTSSASELEGAYGAETETFRAAALGYVVGILEEELSEALYEYIVDTLDVRFRDDLAWARARQPDRV